MARQLLNSEVAILLEAGASPDRDIISSQQVSEEYHSAPHLKRQQWFNTDFLIRLNNWDRTLTAKSRIVPIRPQTLGADFFVMLTPTGIPTQLELLEGESVRKESFREEIIIVEKALRMLPHIPSGIAVDNAPYLRVVRLEKSIAFWVASTTSISELLNVTGSRADAGNNLIGCRTVDSEILIDGVLYDVD
jgi:hypothetical protein